MNNEKFTQIVEEQIQRCTDVLIKKQAEYATADRLHNFRTTAALTQGSMKTACAGFMAKHTVSIYDMCASPNDFTVEQWNEKITDHINYLLLLRCIVSEEGAAK